MPSSGGRGQLVVDFADLQTAINHMASYEREVMSCLDDVDRAMAALQGAWDGAASDAQADAQKRWREGAEQMKGALQQLRTIAATARSNYQDAVAKNAEMWSD